MISDLLFRLKSLFQRSHADDELDDELRFHFERHVEKYVRSGVTREEALRRARLEFGGIDRAKEECRDARGVRWIETILQDLRFGLRMLRKSPGFTAVAILTLGLGIGANTAIFSVVYAALLRPLPYSQPDRLLTLGEVRSQQGLASDSQYQNWSVSYPDYLDWARQSKAFQSIAGFDADGFIMKGGGGPQVVSAAQATTNFFSTLGVQPFLGRDFAAGEDIAAGPKVAILTYQFWRTQLGGDPNVLGRTMQLDANSVGIIGVLPKEFEFAPRGGAQFWVPMHIEQEQVTRRNLRWMRVVARLSPGTTATQAAAEMGTITSRLSAAYPQEDGKIQVVIIPLRERIVGQVRPLLLVLFGAVGFVLMIACANVANLFMARANGRRVEFILRAALGAGRGRLISQLLVESLMLAAAGAALGLLVAHCGTSLLIGAIPKPLLNSMPFLGDGHANAFVFAFLCAATIFAALAFGLAPALQISHQRMSAALTDEVRGSAGRGGTRLRDACVVAEIAFCVVLLAGAGLMVRSLSALLHRNPGFDARNLLTFSVNLPENAYPKGADGVRFDREFANGVSNLPGILGIASNSVIPITGDNNTIRFLIEGQPVTPGQEDESSINDVSTAYFPMMKIPLVAGRFFNDADDSGSALKHVIVNQAWVIRYLHGENPVGKRIKFTYSPTQPYREIVGVVGDTAGAALDGPDEPALFVPFSQAGDTYFNYIVRTAGNPALATAAIREALRQIDPQLMMVRPLTMDQIVAESPSVFLRRYPSYLIGSFAGLALILAAVGLYGLISYSVSQRTRELGIRIALGAQPRDVLRLVMGEGARLAMIGVAIGVAAALALTQLLRNLLFGVSAFDPPTLAAVCCVIAIVAMAACYVPARRAMGVDPMTALRCE